MYLSNVRLKRHPISDSGNGPAVSAMVVRARQGRGRSASAIPIVKTPHAKKNDIKVKKTALSN